MSRISAWITAALIGITLATAGEARAQVEVQGGPSSRYFSQWFGLERTWLGPDLFANRLQDWRLKDGWLECLEASERLPLRTVHLLTRSLGRNGTLDMSVVIGTVDRNAKPRPDALAGFLIGAGGAGIDPRITAMVHHRPARDGGLMAVVDGNGIVGFRDNESGDSEGNLWTIGGPLRSNDAPLLVPTWRKGTGFEDRPHVPIALTLAVRPEGETYTLQLEAHELDSGRFLSEATLRGIEPRQVDGSVALVSHLGPKNGQHGFRFWHWNVNGSMLRRHDDREFGPVLCTLYTVSDGTLNLTAQVGPIGPADSKVARLQTRDVRGIWKTVAAATYQPDSCTFPFSVKGWDSSKEARFRVSYDLRTGPRARETTHYEGTIRAEPWDANELVVGALTCHKVFTGGLAWNRTGIWLPHRELVDAVRHHDPDLLYFSGDQIYEGDLTPVQRKPEERAIQDYLYKWYRWCWSFGELTRERPTIVVPDDHDVYHGNIWGAGGKKAEAKDGLSAQDSGGYVMSPRFVNAVHRTQTSHLPEPVDPAPALQDISVYFTRLEYAGVSFAILSDRQFKSAPAVAIPDGKVKNGWFQNPDFDPVTQADVPGAKLLGDRQLEFLREWALDWSRKAWMKVALSQTIFTNLATLPVEAKSGSVTPSLPIQKPGGYAEGEKHAADTDSGGWPQSGRNRALRELRRARAVHIAGDQHLGATLRYGIDDFRDAGYAFSTPSIANTWPRRWFPAEPGANRDEGTPRYCGDFRDGFGNAMTVYAVANPEQTGREPARLYDRAPGYGILRFGREDRSITIECWPRWIDPSKPGAKPFEGWPIRIQQTDNDGRTPVAWLPKIRFESLVSPVVHVVDEASGEVLYATRVNGREFQPGVFAKGTYTLRYGDPDASGGKLQSRSGLVAGPREEVGELVLE